MPEDVTLFPPNLVQRFNRYCRQLGSTDLAEQAFRKSAGAIASQLQDDKKERDRLMRCREWLRLALTEEFRNYAPAEAIRSVAGPDQEGLLAFLPDEEDAPLRNVLRLLGLNLLVNKIASGEVLVTTAGSVASGKSTLICNLSGIDTGHLRNDEKGQSVVTLLVTPGSAKNLVAMPLSGNLQGRGQDSDEVWGSTATSATAHLAQVLRARSGEPIPLAGAMDYFAGNVFDAARLACLKLIRPAADGQWNALETPGAKVTLLDARGFNTIADPQTVESGHLFAQGAEVPVVLVSLHGEWIPDAGSPDGAEGNIARRDLVGSDYAEYLQGIAAVLGKESCRRMIVVFTFLSHLVGQQEPSDDIPADVMTRRVCKYMGETVRRVGEILRNTGLDPNDVRWLMLDNVSLKGAERRQAFWQHLPPEIAETYGTEDQFREWFVRDGGLTGVCAVTRSTVQDIVLPRRRQEAAEILRLFGGDRFRSIFNDTFPHLVPEYRELFREKPFMDFTRHEFNDRLDTQQVEGAARSLQDKINSLGATKAHKELWASSTGGSPTEIELDPTQEMFVREFYLGASTGVAALLHSRCDAGTPPSDARVVEVGLAAFADILESVASRDGEGTKDYLKTCLREVTGKVREAFADFSPMAQELFDAVGDSGRL